MIDFFMTISGALEMLGCLTTSKHGGKIILGIILIGIISVCVINYTDSKSKENSPVIEHIEHKNNPYAGVATNTINILIDQYNKHKNHNE